MIFSFLKYLQPVHYFIIKRNNGKSIFPKAAELPPDVQKFITIDNHYSSETARDYDLSWRAMKGGFLGETDCYENFNDIPLVDNYRFARNYFSKFWVIYVLLMRCATFHNPIREITAFRNSKNSFRRSIEVISHEGITNFSSNLLEERPRVTVIIPTLNRYKYLKDALEDLEKQTYKNFEVIIVDQSNPFNEEFYKNFRLDLKVIPQQERALWLARNTAINKSEGDYILLYDDDSRVETEWIRNHLTCLDFFNADISSGVSISKVGADIPKNYSFYRISDQLDTGNVMIKKEVFKQIGLFDRQFENQRMGDGEFGLRAFLNGYRNISNPKAKRLHLKVESGGLREMGSWDAFRTKKLFAPRPIPSVLYLFRKYFGNKAAKFAILRTVPFSIIPYRFKSNKILLVSSVFLAIILIPYIFFQVILSWNYSTKKLQDGAIIPKIKN